MEDRKIQKVEVELTNKRWKKMQAVATIIALAGILVGIESGDGYYIVVAIAIAVVIDVIAEIGSWWTNG